MKKFIFLAVLCLLASASPVSAQLIIRNNGHAVEKGRNICSLSVKFLAL